jgi:hypothetical protein
MAALNDLDQLLLDSEDNEEFFDLDGDRARRLLERLSDVEWAGLGSLWKRRRFQWQVHLAGVLDPAPAQEAVGILVEMIECSLMGPTSDQDPADYACDNLPLSLPKISLSTEFVDHLRERGPSRSKDPLCLARLLLASGHPDEALVFGAFALMSHEKLRGKNYTLTQEAAQITAETLTELGRTNEAEAMRARYHIGHRNDGRR